MSSRYPGKYPASQCGIPQAALRFRNQYRHPSSCSAIPQANMGSRKPALDPASTISPSLGRSPNSQQTSYRRDDGSSPEYAEIGGGGASLSPGQTAQTRPPRTYQLFGNRVMPRSNDKMRPSMPFKKMQPSSFFTTRRLGLPAKNTGAFR